MSGGEESFLATECTQTELPPVLELVEHAPDDVAGFAEVLVIVELNFAALTHVRNIDSITCGNVEVNRPVRPVTEQM